MDVEALIKSIDIVEYISQFVELEQRGTEFWGLSPFKDEKTPSFSVRKETNRFFDFSSGIGGNVYTFVRYFNNCSPREAVDILLSYSGYSEEEVAKHEKMAATKVCKRYVPSKEHQKQSKAVILPDDYMERYEDDESKLQIWRDEGISDASLSRFQVKYDSFSERIVYPIRNIEGKIVNIGGRTVDPLFKEKGLRKYCYFKQWGTMDTIYGIAENAEYIRKSGEIILFEGCKSVLIADTWGIRNCGAILTSHLSPAQMKILARLGVHVVFALDNDVDIMKDHNVAKLKRYVNVSYLKDRDNLLSEKDSPVDKGKEVFDGLYAKRIRYR